MKIAFMPISTCKNNRRIWRHNASSCDVTVQLWWRHNAKTENTILGDDGKMSDPWLFIAELCVRNIKKRVRNKIIHSLLWTTIFWSLLCWFANDFHSWQNSWLCHSWKSLANHLTYDQKIAIHGNSCIILYIIHRNIKMVWYPKVTWCVYTKQNSFTVYNLLA